MASMNLHVQIMYSYDFEYIGKIFQEFGIFELGEVYECVNIDSPFTKFSNPLINILN